MPLITSYYENLSKEYKAIGREELEIYDPDKQDGTFLMCFKDWRNIYTNLFVCIDFPDEWSGIRVKGQWTSKSYGIVKNTQKSMKLFAEQNNQYVFKLKNTKKSTT